ncbi:MAG: sugar O-acetyltransferase [Alistipes sp.]|nr:sugar O-acetyltransferase [Alistipes sp.]
MKSEYEKMLAGELYDFSDPEIESRMMRARRLVWQLNNTPPYEQQAYRRALEELIPSIPESTYIVQPLFCDMGDRIYLGEEVFINSGCTMLDTGGIRIGRHTKLGPGCRLYTPQHPIDYMQRRGSVETAYGITIGEDCWIGGSVTICPGVSIGDRVVVAAGSVVTRNVPDDVLVAGNPAVIKRRLRD